MKALKETNFNTFARIFSGRDDAYGSVAGACVKGKVTVDLYRRHLFGQESIGIYPLRTDGTCRWAAIDIDFDDLNAAISVAEQLALFGFTQGVFIEKSKSKGYHVLLFVSDWILAKELRVIMRSAVILAGLKDTTELFPKQDSLEGLHYGNYLNLPYFGGDNVQGRRMVIDPKTASPIPCEPWLSSIQVFPANEISFVLEKLPGLPKNQSDEPKAEDLIKRPLQIGERRPALVKLAGYLRYRGVSEEIAVVLIKAWANQAFSEPLDSKEAEKHIRGIYRRYGSNELEPGQVLENLPDSVRQEIEELWQ